MSLHLIKLCVGAAKISDLAEWQDARLAERRAAGVPEELFHITRQTPKRAEELLDGGSLYWVIGGVTAVRQKLLELRPVERDGIAHCALVYDRALITVQPRPKRPFQGWRYLTGEDAPPDLGRWAQEGDSAAELHEELIRVGLL